MNNFGYDTYIYGKVDIGANILASYENATKPGFHGGPSLSITTRSANILRATKEDPIDMVNDDNSQVHKEDPAMVAKCIQRLEQLAADTEEADTKPWFLYWFVHGSFFCVVFCLLTMLNHLPTVLCFVFCVVLC